jgi:type IV pilus assembly protein PilQ
MTKRWIAIPLLPALLLTAQTARGQPVVLPKQAQEAPTSRPASEESHELTVNAAGLFDAHMRDVPLSDVMRLMSLRSQRNITVCEGATARVSADLFQVTFEEALEALLTPAGYAWLARGKFVYVFRPEERDKLVGALDPAEVRFFELNFIPAAEVVPIITKLLSLQGVITSTSPSKIDGVAPTAEDYNAAIAKGLGGKSRAVGECIIIRDYPEVLEQVATVIARLDVRPRQVLIEAVILRARLDETNALGIDFNALAGIDFRTEAAASIGGTNLTPGPIPARNFDMGLGAVQTDLASAVPAGGFSFGVITNNVAAFVRALEAVVDLTIVANPKVLTANEQLGRVLVGREDGYLTTTVTETTSVQTVDFIRTGTQILFRPFIGNDGYVRMDIHPEDSSGGLTPANLPFKDTTEVTSNVLVKDGHTLVIGGLFRDLVTSRNNQLPWLGNIPLVGALFRGKVDQAVREEMIVLLTPHIINGDDASAESAQVLADVERWRVLAHRGLMPWGRERLAQAHYRWALEHHRAGRLFSARWDAELALSLNPRFVDADKLREELSRDETAESDDSVIHGIVRRLIEQELAPPAPDEPEAATPVAEPNYVKP